MKLNLNNYEMEHEKEEAKKPKKLEWLNRINHFYCTNYYYS